MEHTAANLIQVRNRQRRVDLDRKEVVLFCDAIMWSLNLTKHALSVAFVGNRMMRQLNNRWRGKNYATDVLSFSFEGEAIDGLPFLGEIVIAPEVAVKQALDCGASPEREIRKLLVHGALHLMGYDHETDGGQMNEIQRRLLRRSFFTAANWMILRENGR